MLGKKREARFFYWRSRSCDCVLSASKRATSGHGLLSSETSLGARLSLWETLSNPGAGAAVTKPCLWAAPLGPLWNLISWGCVSRHGPALKEIIKPDPTKLTVSYIRLLEMKSSVSSVPGKASLFTCFWTLINPKSPLLVFTLPARELRSTLVLVFP